MRFSLVGLDYSESCRLHHKMKHGFSHNSKYKCVVLVHGTVVGENDACNFASNWQVLDAELAAVRHEKHQGNQRAAAHQIGLVFTWVLLTVRDFKKERKEKVNERFFFYSSQTRFFCAQQCLRHISLTNTRCDLVHCWAAIKHANPYKVPILPLTTNPAFQWAFGFVLFFLVF